MSREERVEQKFQDLVPGSRVRSGHEKTLFSILGEEKMIPISSHGDHFYMVGHFPYRKLVPLLASFSSKKPDSSPTFVDFVTWAAAINEERNVAPSITIANTSNDAISRRTYMALIGGANHEGFHRLYTAQGSVTARDLQSATLPFWDPKVPYGKMENLLLETMNIFEDIRIERIGCAEFPGVFIKMADLADFILDQEADLRRKEASDPKEVSPLRISLGALRELGLGYSTIKTREAMDHYRKVCPEAVERVESGELAPLLREIIPDVSTPEALRVAKDQGALSTELALRALAIFAKDPIYKKEAESGVAPKLKDYSIALQEVLLESRERTGNLYTPYRTDKDEVQVVRGDPIECRRKIAPILQINRSSTMYLRTRLRNLFLALEDGDRNFGVRKGFQLSDRHLVDTYATLSSGREPNQAFVEDTLTIDTSICAYVVVDESSSMNRSYAWVVGILYILGDSLDSINAKFSVVGFQSKWNDDDEAKVEDEYRFHRNSEDGILHNVFKGFEERWKEIYWRLARVHAGGGTPMADGIELGLRGLSERREGHRILFVVTDGNPDPNHAPVVREQIRRAEEAGIHLVGVGLGEDARYVQDLFPIWVWAESELSLLPPMLVQKITDLVRKIGTRKRGRTVQVLPPKV